MRNYITMFLALSVSFFIAPMMAPASEKSPGNTSAIVEMDTGNSGRDVPDEAAGKREARRLMRRNKFYLKLYKLIDSGKTKKAEKLLEKYVRDVPERKDDEAYLVAKSKIAYAKGDYQSAYAEADKFIADIEKAFAPQKPYEVSFKNKNEKDSTFRAYILRFQALSGMQRHEEALADLERAQQLTESPELLRAKTSTLLWLGKYAEAAAAADKAYAIDKNIFASSPYRESYCRHFSARGYIVKACADSAAATKGKAVN